MGGKAEVDKAAAAMFQHSSPTSTMLRVLLDVKNFMVTPRVLMMLPSGF